jgi:predicted small secreted protein
MKKKILLTKVIILAASLAIFGCAAMQGMPQG